MRSEVRILKAAKELEAFAAEQRRRDTLVWWQGSFENHRRYIETELSELRKEVKWHRKRYADRKRERKKIREVLKNVERLLWPEDFVPKWGAEAC